MSTIWPEISGYARVQGAPGLRNHVLAFSTVALTDVVTHRAAQSVPGVLPVLPRFERGLRGVDAQRQARAIEAVVAHPNTGAALVVTHDRAAAADRPRARAVADGGAPWGALETSHPGYAVEPVDTTGAGDGFLAGVLSGLADGKSLDAVLGFANAVAALTTTEPGANTALPDRETVTAFRDRES